MSKAKAQYSLRRTANKNNISLTALTTEINEAIAAGMKNPDPQVQAFWQSVPKKDSTPTAVELLTYLYKTHSRS